MSDFQNRYDIFRVSRYSVDTVLCQSDQFEDRNYNCSAIQGFKLLCSGAVLGENIWGIAPPPEIEAPKEVGCGERMSPSPWGRGLCENFFLLFNLEMMYFGAHLRYSDVYSL